MSDILRIGVICEGPTDRIVIEASLQKMVNKEFVLTTLQPEISELGNHFGIYGGGWKGVRSYCSNMSKSGSFSSNPALRFLNLIIVHIDADIAGDDEIQCEKECPPPFNTVKELRKVLLSWMKEDQKPENVVFCIPSKNTEAWVYTALFPDDSFVTNIECRQEPEALLIGKADKLVRKKGKKYHKETSAYQSIAYKLTQQWLTITEKCIEAQRFSNDLVSKL